MQVVFISSEITPYASTGGLAEVCGELPLALQEIGVRTQRIMPLYRQVFDRAGENLRDTGLRLSVPVGLAHFEAEIWVDETPAATTWFIGRDEFFDRSYLYGSPRRGYEDNLQRFTFFQKAAVLFLDQLSDPADVVHIHDWQTGLVPAFLRYGVYGEGRNVQTPEKTVFTIHNLAYQGIFPGEDFAYTNLPFGCFNIDDMEYYGNLSFIKAGITGSDQVTTVSPTYAGEIQESPLGCGLEGLLRNLPRPLKGIVNGIDTEAWDPQTDPHLPVCYSSQSRKGKSACKQVILQSFGLDAQPDRPLAVVIGRLVDQKGLGLIDDALDRLIETGFNLIVLGSGQSVWEQRCRAWNERFPQRVGVQIDFDIPLAHQLEAAADVFLMPSSFEPCGLNQMYSQRYGTVPIVHATGGLADTVEDAASDGSAGTGFTFTPYTQEAFLDAVQRAFELYQKPKQWAKVQRRGMEKDFSWYRAAEHYQHLYEAVGGWEGLATS